MSNETILKKLLEECAQYSSEYKGHLSDHQPMTLFALANLGASDEHLIAFANHYNHRLEPKAQFDFVITAQNWKNSLGEHRYEVPYVTFFSSELKRIGPKKLLETYLPTLLIRVGSGGFHPLIRVAYAIEASVESEVVEGLAAWAIASLSTRDYDLPRGHLLGTQKPLAVLLELSECQHLASEDWSGDTISAQIGKVLQNTTFRSIVAKYDSSGGIEEIASAMCKIYASTNDNFIALHMVTSTHAYRLLLPFLKFPHPANFQFFEALCASYVTIGCPFVSPHSPPPLPLPSWKSIKEAALLTSNEHVIKLVHTCIEESKVRTPRSYQWLAARKALNI